MILTFTFLLTSLLGLPSGGDVFALLKNGNLQSINQVLAGLEKAPSSSTSKAYMGALLMKKADFEKSPITKLNTFKKGHEMLESEISQSADNVEFRLLRLMIQEHAPKILGYDTNLKEDQALILSEYPKLSAELKKHIYNYSLESTLFSSSDLKN